MNHKYDYLLDGVKNFGSWLKFLCLTLILTSALPEISVAQTITIGTGTSSSYTYGPIYRSSSSSSFDYCKYAYLFTASELATAGLPAGAVISSIEWNRTSTDVITGTGDAFLDIYMNNSSATSLSSGVDFSTFISGATTVMNGVYNTSNNFPAATGWMVLPFTTNFVYTGGAIEIAADWDISAISGSPTSGAFNWEYTSGNPGTYTIYSNGSTASTTLSSSSTNRPNIRINYFIPIGDDAGISSVDAPVAPAVPGLNIVNATIQSLGGNTLTSADIDWEVNGVPGTTYNWAGSLTAGQTDGPLSLGSATFADGNNVVKVWTVNPNGGTDTNNGNDTLEVNILACNPLAGNYTIDQGNPTAGSNFNSFDDAINALLTCGLSGNVTFNVTPSSGPYTSQVVIPEIIGAGPGATVTFNGNGESLNFLSTTSAERHGFRLDGADYITIENFVINGLASSTSEYAWGIQLAPGSQNNIIQNNTININNSLSSTNHAGIIASGSNTSATTGGADISYNQILNNVINGGYYSISFYSTSSGKDLNNIIADNTCSDFYSYGIYLYYNEGTQVLRNDVSRPFRTNPSSFYGIYLSTACDNMLVDANRIHNPNDGNLTSTSLMYPIYISGADAGAGTPNLITNNLIYNINGDGTIYGIYNTGSDNSRIYHNTISLDDQTANAGITRGFYQTTTASGIEFFNNIVTITRSGSGVKHVLHYNAAASTIASNNNVLYINAPGGSNNLAYVSGATLPGPDMASLAELQTTGYDAGSVSLDPLYTDPGNGDFTPASSSVNNAGTAKGVLFDILGSARDASFPDPGAFEFTPAGLDASITWVAPVAPVGAGLADVVVNISNTQTATINSVDLTYTDGVTTVNEVFPVTITAGNNLDLTFATQFNITATHELRAYINSVNSITDNDQVNDTTISVTICPAMAGAYTIDQTGVTGGTNFASFADAIAAMQSCGITASVTFTVIAASGPYAEQVVIPAIDGVSPSVTITFDGSGEEMNFSSSTSADRSGFRLDGASYVTIKNFIINPQGTYGWGIHLYNASHDNILEDNELNLPFDNSSTNYVGIAASGSLTSYSSSGLGNDNNIVRNNTIRGGYIGVSFYGNGSTAQVLNNEVSGNTIEDWYNYGIYLYGNDGAIARGNDLSKPNRVSSITTFYGVYLSTGTRGTLVEKNQAHNPFGGDTTATSAFYPFYASGADATSGNENDFINNLAYDVRGGGVAYAFYNSSSDYCRYYHNTVVLDNPWYSGTSSARGWYQTTAATGLDYKNNLVYITRGNGTNYGYYMATSTSTFTSDNNDLYVNSPGGTNNIAYISGTTTPGPAQIDLSELQANGYDLNSRESDPGFVDATNNDYTPSNAVINNIGANIGVTEDLYGTPRNVSNPDPGAIEFTPTPIDLKITVLGSPFGPKCFTASETVSVTVVNGGANDIDFSVTPADVSYSVSGATIANVTETLNSGTLLSGASMLHVFSTNLDMSAFGTYNIDANVTIAGDGNPGNDNLAPTVAINFPAPEALPLYMDFALFDGSNLDTQYPGWTEASGVSSPSSNTSLWNVSSATQTTGFGSETAKVNMFTTTRNEWIVGPKFIASADTKLEFALAVTNANTMVADAMGSDDALSVMVTTDCGVTWSPVSVYNAGTGLTNAMQPFSVSLSAYAGQDILVAFYATDGPVDDIENYDLHIDDIVIRDVVFDNIGASTLISPLVPAGSCFSNAETMQVEVTNWGGNSVDFALNPFTIEWNVAGPISNSGSYFINTGSLASTGTATFTIPVGIDMSAPGTYTFDAYTAAAWDNLGGSTSGGDNSMAQVNVDNVVIAVFPSLEDLETATTGTPGTPPLGWELDSPTSYNWQFDVSTTISGSTGPEVDHTLGTAAGIFLYTEASSGSAGDTTRFISPCVDFSSLTLPGVEFWYHFYGSDIDRMYIDVFSGGVWINEVDSIIGQVQTSNADDWLKKRVNLSAFAGQIVKVRFSAIRGSSFAGDMAIDDISFLQLPTNNISAVALAAPNAASGACLSNSETLSIRVLNNGLNTLDFSVNPFDVVWDVSGATTASGTFNVSSGTLAPAQTIDVDVTTTLNMSAPGTYYVDAYTSAAWDTDGGLTSGGDNSMATDSVANNAITSLPHLEDLETALTGSPGTPPNGWTLASSSTYNWYMNSGTTTSSSTGPDADHTSGAPSGIYAYTESIGSTGDTAQFISPCVDLSSTTLPAMDFWYHFYGATIDKMYVEINSGGTWSILDSIVGEQQTANSDPWLKKQINLVPYAGQVVRVRFSSIKGSSFTGDMAIDDIRFFEFATDDILAEALVTPGTSALACYSAAEPLTIRVKNNGANALDFSTNNFNIVWDVSGINPQSGSFPVTSGVLAPFATMDYQVAIYDMSAVGQYRFNAYTSASWDSDGGLTSAGNNSMASDTIDNVIVAAASSLENFETAVSGTPGLPPANWTATPTSGYAWSFDAGGTTTANTGPTVDHTLATNVGKYVYAEASSGAIGDVTSLYSPCVDLAALAAPGIEFWYHFYGSGIDRMYVDVFANGVWNSNLDSIVGSHQTANSDPWLKKKVNLSAYTGQIVKARFRAIRGASDQGDLAIDDVAFVELPALDPGIISLNLPVPSSCYSVSEPVEVTIKNFGGAIIDFAIDNTTVVVDVTGVVVQNFTTTLTSGTLSPGAGMAVPMGFLDMSTVGNYLFDAYTSVLGDADMSNDTLAQISFSSAGLSPEIASTLGDTRCGPGDVTLTATPVGSSTIAWYADATGGSPLAAGNSLVLTTSADTALYAAAVSATGVSAFVGETGIQSGAGTGGGLSTYMNFDAISDFTLQTVDLFPYGSVDGVAGTVTVELRTSTGTPIMSQVVNVIAHNNTAAAGQTVALNFPVTGGASYRLGVTSWTGGVSNLYRDAGGSYPYTIPGLISITGPSTSGWYYFFYNWGVSSACESPRQLVSATVTPSTPITASGTTTICEGDATLISASNGSGNNLYEWNPGAIAGQSISVSPAITTTYIVTATDQVDGCTAVDTVVITVDPAPIANATASDGIICEGTSTDLMANASAGNLNESFSYGGAPVPTVDNTIQYVSATVSGVSGNLGSGTSIASVCININHTFDGDLDIYLVHPNGVDSLELSTDNGSTGDDYIGTCFVTGAPNITTGSAPFTGNFAPEGAAGYALFNGLTANGVWKLSVGDDAGGDGGNINSFEITFTIPVILSYSWTAVPADPSLAGQENLDNLTVSPAANTVYTSTVTNTVTGCQNISTVNVDVFSAPVATITPAGPVDICQGSNVMLTAASGVGYTYVWSNSATSQSILADVAGTYYVTVSTAGCTPVVSSGVVVNVVNNPTVVTINSVVNNNPCPGASYDLTAVGPSGTYTWSGPSGYSATGAMVTVSESGTYSVVLNDGIDPCPTVPATINITTNACQVCSTPTGLSSSNVGAVSADISWSPAYVGDDFLVRYWDINNPGAFQYFSVSGTPAVSSMTLDYLAQNTTYVWQVKTLCNSPQPYSKYSQPDTFTTIFGNAPCNYRPSGLFSYGYTPTTAELYWDPVNADAFLVRYEVAGTGIYQWQSAPGSGSGNFSFGSLTGLYPNTTYNWWVLGICNGVKSRYSAMGNFSTPPGNIPCVKPFDTRAINIGTTTATVEWNTIVSADQFRVRYVEDGPAPWNWAYKTVSGVPHTNEIDLSGLQPITTYRFQVQTICSGVKSDYSTVEYFTTIPLPSGQSRGLTEEVRGSLGLNAYPNPAKDKVTISFGADNEGGKYVARLLDLSGRMLMERNGTASKGQYQEELNLNGLAAGMYLLEVRMGEKQGYLRLIVE